MQQLALGHALRRCTSTFHRSPDVVMFSSCDYTHQHNTYPEDSLVAMSAPKLTGENTLEAVPPSNETKRCAAAHTTRLNE